MATTNHGEAMEMSTKVVMMLKKQPSAWMSTPPISVSFDCVSFPKRLITRPDGVVSKKLIGSRITRAISSSWRFRAALTVKEYSTTLR